MKQAPPYYIVICLSFLVGCATPPEIKQAVVSLDDGYAENIKLMTQFGDLTEQNALRFKNWTLYIQNRAYLDMALLWVTTDPKPFSPNVTGQQFTEEAAKRLGPKVINVVNELRLKNLRSHTGTDGIEVFRVGNKSMTELIEGLPALVNAVRAKVEDDNKTHFDVDMVAFKDYQKNVNALRRINNSVKQYLDIDITVRPEDIKDIADSVRTLSK